MTRLNATLLACLLPFSVMANPQTYAIDPLHSFAHFSVNYLGVTTINGRFDKTAGKVTVDTAAKTGVMEVRVASNSVSTGDAKRTDGGRSRDDHLKSPDFFNSAEFPDIVYKSTKFNFNGDTLESIDGTLTMVGVTKPVKLAVSGFKCGPHPFNKKAMCGADAQGLIKRTDFGMKFGVPAIGDDIKLVMSVLAYQE